MSQSTRLVALLILCAAAALAESWTGLLVDSKCYSAEERNVNPTDTETSVDRDVMYSIRYCSPTHKTKAFALVEQYGERLKFDPAGNAKSADLVRNVNKKHMLQVSVTGEMSGKLLRVDTISTTGPKR